MSQACPASPLKVTERSNRTAEMCIIRSISGILWWQSSRAACLVHFCCCCWKGNDIHLRWKGFSSSWAGQMPLIELNTILQIVFAFVLKLSYCPLTIFEIICGDSRPFIRSHGCTPYTCDAAVSFAFPQWSCFLTSFNKSQTEFASSGEYEES